MFKDLLEKALGENPDISILIVFIIAGIALFLYGVGLMSDGLKKIAGNRLKSIISKSTDTPLKGILVGTLITAIVQSSTGVSVLTVGLVAAGLMTLPQATGIIMGANIGTTVTALIIALPIADFGLHIAAIGIFLTMIFANKKIVKNTGNVLTGLGLLFVGFDLLGVGTKVLFSGEFFINLFKVFSNTKNPFFWLFGTIFGTLFTGIVQSSTLSMGMLQSIYQNGQITLIGAIPLLLGFNIGTTFSSWFASIGQSKDSKRVAMIHILFNVIGSVIFLVFLWPFNYFLLLLQDQLSLSPIFILGLAHTLQNIISAFILFFFVKQQIWLANFLVRDKKTDKKEETFVFNEEMFNEEPTIALSYAKKGIINMSNTVKRFFVILQEYSFKNNESLYEEAIELENILDDYDKKLHDYLIKIVHSGSLDERDSGRLSKDLDTIRNLERIGDHLMNIFEFFQKRYEEDITLSEGGIEDLKHFYLAISEMLEKTLYAFHFGDKNSAQKAMEFEDLIDDLEERFRYNFLERLKTGEFIYNSNSNYPDILSNLERIGDHLTNIAESVLNPMRLPS